MSSSFLKSEVMLVNFVTHILVPFIGTKIFKVVKKLSPIPVLQKNSLGALTAYRD